MSLDDVKDYPLSDGDIRRMLGDDISIKTYPDLAKMRSINECFDSKGRCILLFLTSSPTEGHWCCLLNKKKGIEFFDPYGDKPEKQKEGVPQSRLEALNQSQPYLTKLLRASGRPVYYNTHDFQQDKRSINTCGRHCVVRCLYGPYSLNKYKDIIDASGLSPDNFVSGLTYDKLRK
jgi:hypothetical protein